MAYTQEHLCLKCKTSPDQNKYIWQKFKTGEWMIRGTCGKCKKFLGFVPQTEQYQKLADREKKQESAPVLPRATENLLNARIELTKATEKFNKALDEYMIACKACK